MINNYQIGNDFNLLFAENEDTESWYELAEEESINPRPDDKYYPIFPVRVSWSELKSYYEQLIDNWKYYGEQDDDITVTFCTKAGKIINSDYFTDLRDFKKAVAPVSEKHFLFAIYHEVGYIQFWVNGWDGLLALQQYTNWFDLTLYEDWL